MNISSGFKKQLEIWREIGCPSTRQHLEENVGYQAWKKGKEDRRKRRAVKEKSDKKGTKPAKEKSVTSKDVKHWKQEGRTVEQAIEKLDGQLGEALKRNTEIARRERAAQLEKGMMDDPSQVIQGGSNAVGAA